MTPLVKPFSSKDSKRMSYDVIGAYLIPLGVCPPDLDLQSLDVFLHTLLLLASIEEFYIVKSRYLKI